jgi:hypothetical protein
MSDNANTARITFFMSMFSHANWIMSRTTDSTFLHYAYYHQGAAPLICLTVAVC